MNSKQRSAIAGLALSAAALVGLVTQEGYTDHAVIPVKGDKNTIGFGSTTRLDGSPVQTGDTTTPVKALARALTDIQKFEGALKQCVKVSLHQHEYDAFISLSYNIGSKAFCSSSLVSILNAGRYQEACDQILRWDRFHGRPLRGLTLRRQKEYKQCIGEGYE